MSFSVGLYRDSSARTESHSTLCPPVLLPATIARWKACSTTIKARK